MHPLRPSIERQSPNPPVTATTYLGLHVVADRLVEVTHGLDDAEVTGATQGVKQVAGGYTGGEKSGQRYTGGDSSYW